MALEILPNTCFMGSDVLYMHTSYYRWNGGGANSNAEVGGCRTGSDTARVAIALRPGYYSSPLC